MKEAKLFALKWKDAAKGFVVSILTVVMTGAMATLQLGQIPPAHDLKVLALTGLGAGFAYLVKNFLTNSDGQMLKGEQPK